MIKSIFVGRRAPLRSRRAAQAHLRLVHGALVVNRPSDAGPGPDPYVQNHVFDGAYPEHGVQAIERDLVTEFWFPSLDVMYASGQTTYYLANLKPDEPRFVTTGSVERMRVEETIVRDGPRGLFRLFLFARRAAGVDDDAWSKACADAADALAGNARITALVRNDVIFPDAAARFADVVLAAWLDERDAAADLLDTVSFGPAAEAGRTLVLAAESFDADRLRALAAAV